MVRCVCLFVAERCRRKYDPGKITQGVQATQLRKDMNGVRTCVPSVLSTHEIVDARNEESTHPGLDVVEKARSDSRVRCYMKSNDCFDKQTRLTRRRNLSKCFFVIIHPARVMCFDV